MNAQEEAFLNSLRATFKVEAAEHLQAIAGGLMELEKAPESGEQRERIEKIFRAAHSLKGAARAVNFGEVEMACQSLENSFAAWRREETIPTPQEMDELHRLLDTVSEVLEGPKTAPDSPAPSKPAERPEPIPIAVSPVAAEKSPAPETVRISVAKLDARLLEAEEMLGVKLTTRQRAADLRALSHELDVWNKEWAAIQPEIRTVRETAGAQQAALARLTEFIDWNRDYLRSLESKVAALRQTAERDQAAVGKLVDDLLEDSKKMLMLPAATLTGMFPKVVRDLCRDQGKEADFEIHGEEVEIDKRILEEMKDPFIHLLRNCVDHGIEKPEQRMQLGKPRRAKITLTVAPVNGSKVELLVSDDGSGIDTDKVKETAVERGLITLRQAMEMSEPEAQALVFHSDISTSPIVTELSGRGLGLAIVREKTEKLGGRVSIESRQQVGTTIRISLPVAVATFRGVLVEVAKRQFVAPAAQVERVLRFTPADVQTVEGRETLSLNGRATSLVRLARILELPVEDRDANGSTTLAIVIGTNDQRVAFAVDAVLNEQEVLVKQFGKPLSRVRNIAGATVLGSGQVACILNAADLLKSARKFQGPAVPSPAPAKPAQADAPAILVVEDSITSRMLLKGILESAGYRVKTAVDGLEAFATLRTQDFDLVVSDVEMPRLNGFDLTARIRADKKLAELPVVLVTALESREDRERGVDVGANAYLVKSSFDQSNLLEAVRRLA